MDYNRVRKEIIKIDKTLDSVSVNPNDFEFEEKVKIHCFHCKNYNKKWTCPPNIPEINYRKIFSEYKNGALVYIKLPLGKNDFEEKRNLSTVMLHKSLLKLEKFLFDNDESLVISFIGGSCKLCKNGCPSDGCVSPQLARIPLEATGCNVVSSLIKYNIKVTFPVTDFIYRYGLILW